MKKLILCLLLIVPFILTGCSCEIIEYSSFDRYKERIESKGVGYSDLELDWPRYLLPSDTFFNDYEYIDSTFYFYEHQWFFCCRDGIKSMPAKVLIVLQYEEEIYLEAKACVLENIPVYRDKYYTYNNFQFYGNQNFYDINGHLDVPYFFTMVGYNDTTHTLCFIGFHDGNPKEEKYYEDIDAHWTEFIDQYFGEYYDFSQ